MLNSTSSANYAITKAWLNKERMKNVPKMCEYLLKLH